MKLHRHLVEEVVRALIAIFQERGYADKIIEKNLKAQKKWGARDRRFFAESVYECVRWWRKYQAALQISEPLSAEDVKKIWALWAWTQGVLESPAEWGLHDIAHVEKRLMVIEKSNDLAIRESVPDWLNILGQEQCQDRWPAILHSLNQKSVVDLRVNFLKTTREKLQIRLSQEGIETQLISGVPSGLSLIERKNVFITKAFHEGLFEVQDRASQLVAPLLAPQPGERVIDACAGAGGKSLHLAALMQNKGRIISMDIHEWKLGELKTRARRNGVSLIETRWIENSKVVKRLDESADRVLLDVPCSGLGVLRRNPDSKWKLTLEEIKRLQDLQQDLLQRYSRMVRPGGTLVYATCSFLPSENIEQVEKMNTQHWTLEQVLKIDPDQGRGDGFFAARLIRKG